MRRPGLHFRALDGLRFVGALAVMTTHVGFNSGDALRGPAAGLLSRLDSGVALFFVVSGFLLFRPHAMAHLEGHSRPRAGAYLLRRAVRILPVLWLTVLAAFLLLRGAPSSVGDYLAHAALVQIYLPTPLLAGLTQFWSLATEVAFYLLLPVAARVLCRGTRDRRWAVRTIGLLAALTAIGPVWMAGATAVGYTQARLWLPGFVGWFAVGMALAVWHAARTTGILPPGRTETLAQFPGTVWAMAGAVFVIASTPIAGPLDLSEPSPGAAACKNALYTMIGLLVVLPTVATIGETPEPGPVRLLTRRPAVWLGDVSYGVFAYHGIVLAVVTSLLGLGTFTGSFWVRWVPTLIVTVAIAGASYHFVERPLMARVRGRPSVKRRDPRTTTETASSTKV